MFVVALAVVQVGVLVGSSPEEGSESGVIVEVGRSA